MGAVLPLYLSAVRSFGVASQPAQTEWVVFLAMVLLGVGNLAAVRWTREYNERICSDRKFVYSGAIVGLTIGLLVAASGFHLSYFPEWSIVGHAMPVAASACVYAALFLYVLKPLDARMNQVCAS